MATMKDPKGEMRDLRVKSFEIFQRKPVPTWGVDLIAGVLEEFVPQQAIAKLVPRNPFLAVCIGAAPSRVMSKRSGSSKTSGSRLAAAVLHITNVPAGMTADLNRIRLHAARPQGVNEPTAEGVAGAGGEGRLGARRTVFGAGGEFTGAFSEN